MTREEAKEVFLNRGFIDGIYDGNKWREACIVISKWLEQEPKTGHWIKYDKEYFTAEKLTPVIHSIRECSECHTRIADFCGEMKYCPNCGANMRGEEV